MAEASGAALALAVDTPSDDGPTTTATASAAAAAAAAADPSIWVVKSSSNAESITATGIHNPRDVTMDSSATEGEFGFKFTPTRVAVTHIVRGFEALASV